MRAVLFGSGSPLSRAVLAALGERGALAAVVVPSDGPPRTPRSAVRALAHWRARRPFLGLARELGVPVVRHARGANSALQASLATLSPDLLCVAAFPFRLASSILGIPRWGALNVHPSLLPRHRGPAPLFWTYHADDRETGVTIHWMDERLDTGDIVLQQAVPIGRGRPLTDLYQELCSRGTALLMSALDAVETGRAPRQAQDETQATCEPLPRGSNWRIDFETWGAERLWHFLAGVGRSSLLRQPDGTPVPHGRVLGFTRQAHRRPPGTLERHTLGLRVYCLDGVVDVAGPTLRTSLRRQLLGRGRA
jgi:methionyl-tRNA formyltransferase